MKRTISTRRTAIAAARAFAEEQHATQVREARDRAVEDTGDRDGAADEAERDYCRSVARHPGSASDAWVNAGASKLCGVPERWEPLFLRALDAEAVRLAEKALVGRP